jgi:hypothetical protein
VRTFGDDMASIERRLLELEVPIPPSSRFHEMLRVSRSKTEARSRRAIALAHQASKDLQELAFILRTLFANRPSKELLTVLRRAFQDATLPIRSAKSAEGEMPRPNCT